MREVPKAQQKAFNKEGEKEEDQAKKKVQKVRVIKGKDGNVITSENVF